MIIYADFQCPFCKRFTQEILPELQRRYVTAGQLAIAFRHFPLSIHPQAFPAALTAECAARQGQFWAVHDRLFAATALGEQMLRSLPEGLGLDMDRFDRCLEDDIVRRQIEASVSQGNTLGVRGTPAFFIGERLADGRVAVSIALSGVRPLDDFVRGVDATLNGHKSWWPSWMHLRA
jgi:protein-disulfide isomerase